MKTITPFLWFDGKADEAMRFYTSIFKNSKQGEITPGPNGSIISVTFELDGQKFMALNGGPHFTFSPAISFFVSCETQDEVDHYWERLSDGGEKQPCGWIKDKYGVSWQIIPSALGKLMHQPDPATSQRVMQAMLQMKKLDIAGLERAAAGADPAA